MKKSVLLLALTLTVSTVFAQKVDYKDGVISVDGTPVAKMIKQADKANLGMVSNYEIKNMNDELLIIAVYASEFPEDPMDNFSFYYKFSFTTLDKQGYFKVNKLGTEKAIAKLIGSAAIIKDGALDKDAVFNFISKKGKNPPAAGADYTTVNRNKSWPIDLKENNVIEQDGKVIGNWKDVTPKGSNVDYYEFSLPSGLIVAKANFINGNNAQTADVTTNKDNRKHTAQIPSPDKVSMLASSIDRNQKTLERLVKWLVAQQYL
ncbi:MAG TPA: hypothetical protein VFW78_00555 [Bacteroidia bacterium]|nr:hypothetical protein [Bacteroidia bacterium]